MFIFEDITNTIECKSEEAVQKFYGYLGKIVVHAAPNLFNDRCKLQLRSLLDHHCLKPCLH